MLQLTDITKQYTTGDTAVLALRGISLTFRPNEFVSILGPSGCGKTTLLNIIGGLDRYTSGDLCVNGRSTKEFRDADWDSYRNHSIGFVFQSYNLIPHQTVLANVELALTLSGVSRVERKRRAKAVLEQVGLGDQLNKKPNQMSGGQMQRVAIARALINDPDILLADEPTGALDSETSLQVMELLREVAKDRLVIMVTHNPELARQYSTRIIRLLDGRVIDDSHPYTPGTAETAPTPARATRTSMSFFTALSLSLNNLMTKKARTFLTSFAGSIGIIGIALILSLSSGARAYIAQVEKDTLSSYPLAIEKTSVDLSSLMASAMNRSDSSADLEADRVYSNDIMLEMIHTMQSEIVTNDLAAFRQYLQSADCPLNEELLSAIQYQYETPLNIYRLYEDGDFHQVNPSQILNSLSMPGSAMYSNTDVWRELLGNRDLLAEQYDVLAGRMPASYDEVVLIVDKDNRISDYTLYCLGLKDPEELQSMLRGETTADPDAEPVSYSYDELLSLSFRLLLNTDYYQEQDGQWIDQSENEAYLKQVLKDAEEIKVVGVLRPAENAVVDTARGQIGYLPELMLHLLQQVEDSAIVRQQKADPDTDVFTGKPFADGDTQPAFDSSTLTPEQQAYLASLPEDERKVLLEQYAASLVSQATYDGNLQRLGVSDPDDPSAIYLYPSSFEAKEQITALLDEYNQKAEDDGRPEAVIRYTDYVGLMMSSITTIINAISYILIAFVAISLVVSSIMIGIITYISVLERTKEIGILRSIGASKGDISRVFNAETLIIGFGAGAIGLGITLLLLLPINRIIQHFTDIAGLAVLPWQGAVILLLISMLLTFVAGLIPSRIAARKDPVTALRTE